MEYEGCSIYLCDIDAFTHLQKGFVYWLYLHVIKIALHFHVQFNTICTPYARFHRSALFAFIELRTSIPNIFYPSIIVHTKLWANVTMESFHNKRENKIVNKIRMIATT